MKKAIKLNGHILSALGGALLISSVSSPVWAQQASGCITPEDNASATGKVVDGGEAYKAGKFEKALELFNQAYQRCPLPSIGFNRIKSLEKLGKLLEAEPVAREVLSRQPPSDPTQTAPYENIKKLLEDFSARIPTVTVVVSGIPAGKKAELRLDGAPISPDQPVRINPGIHKITAKQADDLPLTERTLTIKERETSRFELAVVTKTKVVPPPPPPTTLRTAGFITGAVGLAGLGAGAALGVLAIQKNNDSKGDICPDAACAQGRLAARSDAQTFGNASTAAFVVGGVALAAGVTLVLLAPRQGKAPAARVGVGLRGIEVTGVW